MIKNVNIKSKKKDKKTEEKKVANRAQRCEIHKRRCLVGGRDVVLRANLVLVAILVKTILRAILKKSFALHRLKAMMAWIGGAREPRWERCAGWCPVSTLWPS